jgi:pyridoxine 5-phosphate synthase
MAATDAMLEFALQVRPDFVCLVPEKREELTTEGGLNIIANIDYLANIVSTLQKNGIITSLFVDPEEQQITAASDINAQAIEIHTGKYANLKSDYYNSDEFFQIKDMAEYASSLELRVNAGHGLNYHNIKPIAAIPQIYELNIGFAIIAQSVFWGFPKAVNEMKRLMLEERTL